MGLTSLALVVTLSVAAGILAVALLWWWPHLAGSGVRSVAGRAGGVLLLELTVLSLIFVAVNRANEFYASWSDLLGTDTARAPIVPVDRPAAARVTRLTREVTITGTMTVTAGGHGGSGGLLESVRIRGALTGLTAAGYVYLPAGRYRDSPAGHGRGTAGPGGGRLPVVVVISRQPGRAGEPGSQAGTAYSAARLAAAAAGEVAAGRLRPLILVIVPAGTLPARRGCLNIPGGPQQATFFSQDLPAAIEAAYPASTSPARWALAGDTAGGYCAIQLAMTSSQAFAAAAVPPANYTTPPGGVPGGGPSFAAQDSMLWQLRHLPMQPISVLFSGPGAATPFVSLVRPPMRLTWEEPAGASTPASVLDWIGRALRAGAATQG